jgi:hypothetical protein
MLSLNLDSEAERYLADILAHKQGTSLDTLFKELLREKWLALQTQQLIPLNELQQQFRQALQQAGYETHEQIVELVQQVKREMLEELESSDRS